MYDFRDPKNFISNERPTALQEGEDKDMKKVNKSSLWDDHERAFLEDVTLNLIPDDEHMNTKGKTVSKWDKIKKKYTLQKVDREGKVMREAKNESGAKISKKMSEVEKMTVFSLWSYFKPMKNIQTIDALMVATSIATVKFKKPRSI